MSRSRLQEALRWLPLAALVIGLTLLGELFGGSVASTTTPIAEDISATEAYELIQANADNPCFTIIDVRTADDFAQEHIECAVNIDFYSASFNQDIKALDRDCSYLVYCHSGGRSSQTLSLMAGLHFREVYNLTSGIRAWQDAGLPLVIPTTAD